MYPHVVFAEMKGSCWIIIVKDEFIPHDMLFELGSLQVGPIQVWHIGSIIIKFYPQKFPILKDLTFQKRKKIWPTNLLTFSFNLWLEKSNLELGGSI